MSLFVRKTFKKIVEEFQEEETKLILYNQILSPILEKFTEKIYPYVTLLFIMNSINLILIISILIIISLTRKVK